jgi:nucleoside-diphosphate-sugar epimerase
MVCGNGLVGQGLVEFGFGKLQPNVDKLFGRTIDYAPNQRNLVRKDLLDNNFAVVVNAAGPSNVLESLSLPDQYLDFPWRQCATHLSILGELPNPPVYVFISSGSVYGDTGLEGASELTSLNPISPYAEGKLKAELFLQEASRSYRGGIVVLRCFSIYSDNLKSRIPFVIATKMAKNNSFTLSGTGFELRDFVHVKDVARAIGVVGALQAEFLTFNVGTGIGISIEEVCQIAANAFGIEYIQNQTVVFNGDVRKSDPQNLVADISKIQNLGFSASIDPHEGLLRYFQLKKQIL